MDAFAAGQLSRSLDALHSASYFVPEAGERFGALGLGGRMAYFAARSAPMGAVGPKVVAATFFNFSPDLIASAIPAAWHLATPDTVTRVRYEVVEHALPRLLGPELAHSAEIVQAAELLRRTAESIPAADGRPLYAGHAELDWPEQPYAQVWHAITLLREYRGDGHIAVLVANGLSGIEALVTHTATGIGFDPEFGRWLRGWTAEEWDAAVDRLQQRGLLDRDGALTSAGVDLRGVIEDRTDELAYAPWATLAEDEAAELTRTAATLRAAIQAAKVFPSGAFGPRHGQHR
ncbi:SCO6745 family protein [Mycolicibacterium komossense]|uniref:SalK n=1 Tax=Mycolicibacterium komossense TaxID=1779 RepID=A0ABT3CBR0_9MYCO|nr:hypothetical protein [Mycolicibacterium komossense]MCV7226681.1 hypothetical protein [Mycolicibacterium komossense]